VRRRDVLVQASDFWGFPQYYDVLRGEWKPLRG